MLLAPLTRAASSKAASMLRNAGVSSMTLTADAIAHQVRPHDAADAEDVERALLNKGKSRSAPC